VYFRAIGEGPKLFGDEIEQRLALVVGTVEVLRRKGIQGQFLNAEVGTPLKYLLRRVRASPMSLRFFLAVFSGVATVTVLNNRDVSRDAGDLAL
jgi:hypothetical protein